MSRICLVFWTWTKSGQINWTNSGQIKWTYSGHENILDKFQTNKTEQISKKNANYAKMIF